MKTILILGGGTGGTIVANRLAHGLRPEDASIEVVSDSPLHYYQPAQLYIPFGEEDPRKIARSERKLLNPNVKFRIDTISEWLPEKQLLRTAKGEALSYDFLVIATGSIACPETVEGFVAGSDHFYTPEGAYRLYHKLSEFEGGRIVVGVGGIPYKCPVAPLEFTLLAEAFLTRKGIRSNTEMVYTFPLNDVFQIQSVVPVVRSLFEQRSIRAETFFNLESVDPEKKVVKSLEGTELPFDILVMTPPHKGAAFLRGHPMADDDGWVNTDRSTLRVNGLPNVWALGDTTNLPISKAGSTAHFEAPVIVEQIVGMIRHEEPAPGKATYHGHVTCFIDSGYGKATILDFDYDHPPAVYDPDEFRHLQKMAFNKLYWYLVPTAVI
ncbi:NAD(P)/FAD-dependent oxidoreductase [Methylacidimicrobium sp. B4]|uniref:NAD(P)/FAD-dependent oxidoreductase n=1 Tax=Methylacidimicrobium sp. B4 TaxID=2796139 RepID=UPI001A8F8760|nr:FAD/NAD(P)-binding oxidoreductase [Methylacidimicrobium sp. B4]QSR83879.1 NAD(P)/FAD-dependent oxidoreductase [Methylacidimicrobium sp. B4]